MSHEGALSPGIASLPVLDAKTFTLVHLTGGMRRVPQDLALLFAVRSLQETRPLCGQFLFVLFLSAKSRYAELWCIS